MYMIPVNRCIIGHIMGISSNNPWADNELFDETTETAMDIIQCLKLLLAKTNWSVEPM